LFFADLPNGRLIACRDFLNGRAMTFQVPLAAFLKNHPLLFFSSANFSTFWASSLDVTCCVSTTGFGASGFGVSIFFSSGLRSFSTTSCHLSSLFSACILASHAEAPG